MLAVEALKDIYIDSALKRSEHLDKKYNLKEQRAIAAKTKILSKWKSMHLVVLMLLSNRVLPLSLDMS